MDHINPPAVTIVGSGATALFASLELVSRGTRVTIYEHTDRVFTKFRLAASSGLNLGCNMPEEHRVSLYRPHQPIIHRCMSRWSQEVFFRFLESWGMKPVEGSSRRFFPPDREGRAGIDAMRAFLERSALYTVRTGYAFTGFSEKGRAVVCPKHPPVTDTDGRIELEPPVILALGGASWPLTGSDGTWAECFRAAGLAVREFRSANCGFDHTWSPRFTADELPVPLKNCAISFENRRIRGECMLTAYGIEGSPLYTLSRELRDDIEESGTSIITLDLFPDMDESRLAEKASRRRAGDSAANAFRKTLTTDRTRSRLVNELLPGGHRTGLERPNLLKKLPLVLERTRPIAEAISVSGGVALEELTDTFELHSFPGVFCAGEMVDWDAPTGGFLLQGCFATAMTVIAGLFDHAGHAP